MRSVVGRYEYTRRTYERLDATYLLEQVELVQVLLLAVYKLLDDVDKLEVERAVVHGRSRLSVSS